VSDRLTGPNKTDAGNIQGAYNLGHTEMSPIVQHIMVMGHTMKFNCTCILDKEAGCVDHMNKEQMQEVWEIHTKLKLTPMLKQIWNLFNEY
jgi:hypothetical protein